MSSATAHIDGTAPRTTVSIGAPLFTAADGTKYVTPATPVTFSAIDPLVNAVASGVAFTRYSDNGGALQTYSAALSLPEGAHLLATARTA